MAKGPCCAFRAWDLQAVRQGKRLSLKFGREGRSKDGRGKGRVWRVAWEENWRDRSFSQTEVGPDRHRWSRLADNCQVFCLWVAFDLVHCRIWEAGLFDVNCGCSGHLLLIQPRKSAEVKFLSTDLTDCIVDRLRPVLDLFCNRLRKHRKHSRQTRASDYDVLP